MATAKFFGAWACILLCVVFIVLGQPYAGLPLVMAALSIAFSAAPTAW